MYIITPADEASKPSISSPKRVILSRLLALSEMSLQHLFQCLKTNSHGNSWSKILRVSTASFANYSVLLRVDPNIICDKTCSSTDHLCSADSFDKGLRSNARGPSFLRPTLYKHIEQIDLLVSRKFHVRLIGIYIYIYIYIFEYIFKEVHIYENKKRTNFYMLNAFMYCFLVWLATR